ncbi:MAG TPA: hypothetical protein VGM90_24340 [Kofleriaceae bacterium]|jgi:predicted transcriptional regulator
MKDSAILVAVKTATAHVREGRIVLDEPVDLPEGTQLEVFLDDSPELTPEEIAELDAACAEADAEAERGELVDAREFIRQRLIKGHVHKGQIVLDEPADLTDGTPVDVTASEQDDFDGMTAEERAELEAGIAEGIADIERGDVVPAREVIQRLIHKS